MSRGSCRQLVLRSCFHRMILLYEGPTHKELQTTAVHAGLLFYSSALHALIFSFISQFTIFRVYPALPLGHCTPQQPFTVVGCCYLLRYTRPYCGLHASGSPEAVSSCFHGSMPYFSPALSLSPSLCLRIFLYASLTLPLLLCISLHVFGLKNSNNRQLRVQENKQHTQACIRGWVSAQGDGRMSN